MSVFASIATIFIENLIAVAGLLAAIFMVVEYYRKSRNRSIVVFAAAFASVGIGFLVGFIGQLLYVYLDATAGGPLVLAQKHFISAGALLMVLAVIQAYRLPRAMLQSIIAITVFVLLIIHNASLSDSIKLIEGIPVNVLAPDQAYARFLPWLFANAFILFVSGRAFLRGRRSNRRFIAADLYLFRGALVGMLLLSVFGVLVVLQLGMYLWANLILLLIQMILLFFGGLAKGHPDEVVADRPENVINRSLVFKALSVNTALFWVLAFALVVITATYFVSSLVAERQEVMVRDLRLFTTTHRTAGKHLLDNAQQFASHPALSTLVETGSSGDLTAAIASTGITEDEYISIIVLDADGTVLYGGEHLDGAKDELLKSDIVRRALSGQAVAGVERDEAVGVWTLRAGAPIILSDGSIGGVVIGTDAVDSLGLNSFEEFTVSRATGFGYLSNRGEVVYEAGQHFDALTLHTFERHVNGTLIRPGTTRANDIFFVAGVERTDGRPDGLFYIFLSRDSINSEIFQILSVIMIFVTLFVMVVAAVLVFSMLLVLRPIRELKEASRRIEHADYDIHVGYDKPDELGQLASAFNSMSTTIKDRTSHLNEALRQQRDFLTHTAQEMRNPLNIFRWSLEMLRFGDTGPLNKEQLELVEQMHQTNERIRKLVMNLVDTSLIEKGTFELRRDYTKLEDIIDDAAGALSVRIREKNINLHWNHPERQLPKAYADQERVYQVVLNLLSNAVKYTHRNGHIEVQAREVDVSGPSGKRGEFVQVQVEDNGRGIPRDQQPKIFTRFFRARNVVAEEIEGAGLGLYISKRIIDLHGGELWFESSEGEGSTFMLTIPIKKP
jgi:signal transduction histidine kinase